MAGKKNAKAPLDEAIVAALMDSSPKVRRSGLEIVSRFDVTKRATVPDGLLDGLRKCVREAPNAGDARHAIFVLGHLGKKGAPAGMDVVRALGKTENPHQAQQTLVAFGSLPAEARPILEAYVRGDDSGAADAATRVLEKMFGGAPEVSIGVKVARLGKELASKDPDVRYGAILGAKKLGKTAAALIPKLRAAGDRVANKKSVDDRVELDAAREALLALGCAPADLPGPKSRYEAHEGSVPRDDSIHVFGAYAVGEITRVARHGVVGVPLSSHGVWDEKTGKLLFFVDDARLLEIVPQRKEAAVLRTVVRKGAKHGGTSRADHDWFFERYAIPSGERLSSLRIPKRLTYGWPAAMRFRKSAVEIVGGDEDAPYKFPIALGEGKSADRLGK